LFLCCWGKQLPQIIGGARTVVEDTGRQHLVWLFIYVILPYILRSQPCASCGYGYPRDLLLLRQTGTD